MSITVGTKVTAYEGHCIGIKIISAEWYGEVVKVNAKSIRVRITENSTQSP